MKTNFDHLPEAEKCALELAEPNWLHGDSKTRTFPLHRAIKNGNVAHARALIAAGANKDSLYEDGTPLHLAISRAHRKNDFTPLNLLLEQEGIDLNITMPRKGTALYVAVELGNVAIITALLKAGADANAIDYVPGYPCYTPGNSAKTPLHAAVRAGRYDIISLLLAHGADINGGMDRKAVTSPPLQMAVDKGNSAMVEFLLNHGANANQKHNPIFPQHEQPKTPLEDFLEAENMTSMKLSLAVGALTQHAKEPLLLNPAIGAQARPGQLLFCKLENIQPGSLPEATIAATRELQKTVLHNLRNGKPVVEGIVDGPARADCTTVYSILVNRHNTQLVQAKTELDSIAPKLNLLFNASKGEQGSFAARIAALPSDLQRCITTQATGEVLPTEMIKSFVSRARAPLGQPVQGEADSHHHHHRHAIADQRARKELIGYLEQALPEQERSAVQQR